MAKQSELGMSKGLFITIMSVLLVVFIGIIVVVAVAVMSAQTPAPTQAAAPHTPPPASPVLEEEDAALPVGDEDEDEDEPPEQLPEPELTITPVDFYTYFTAANLHLRTGPSTEYDSLGVVPRDTSVSVVGRVNDDWVQVRTRQGTWSTTLDYIGMQTGFMAYSFLADVEATWQSVADEAAVATLPPAVTTPTPAARPQSITRESIDSYEATLQFFFALNNGFIEGTNMSNRNSAANRMAFISSEISSFFETFVPSVDTLSALGADAALIEGLSEIAFAMNLMRISADHLYEHYRFGTNISPNYPQLGREMLGHMERAMELLDVVEARFRARY